MEIRCIVIDDEPPALQVLSAYIQQCSFLKLVRTFDDAVAVVAYLHSLPFLIAIKISIRHRKRKKRQTNRPYVPENRISRA